MRHPIDIDPDLLTDADGELADVYCEDFFRRLQEQGTPLGRSDWAGWNLTNAQEVALNAMIRTTWCTGFTTGLYVGERRDQLAR